MGHRIFIAINLPEEIKDKLVSYQYEVEDLFSPYRGEDFNAKICRWTKKENLHVTLEFLGYLTDEELIELCQKTRESVCEKKSFNLNLNEICYGPPDKKPPRSMNPSDSFLGSSASSTKNKTPRMVWVTGERIKEFNITPHITLGRIKTWQFKQIDPEERPEIKKEIDLTFKVKSIEIMESRLKRGGLEYIVLESIPLSK